MERENILDLLPKERMAEKSIMRHTSRYHSKVVRESSNSRKSRALFGPPKTPLRHPQNFLRRGEGENLKEGVRRVKSARAMDSDERLCIPKPSIPRCSTLVPRSKSVDNFITRNKVTADHLLPPTPSYRAVTCHKGWVEDRTEAGLCPRYSLRQSFGKVPPYLQKKLEKLHEGKKRKSEEEKKEREEKGKEKVYLLKGGNVKKGGMVLNKDNYKLMEEEQKNTIRKGLLSNLSSKQSKLQKLPIICETRSSIASREALEKDIAAINSYLHLLDRYEVTVRNIG